METAFYNRMAAQMTCDVAMGAAPRDTAPPFAVAQRIGGAIDMELGSDTGFREQNVQIDVYGRSYAEAMTHYEEAIAAFNGWRDPSVNIYGCFVTPRGDAGMQRDLDDQVFRMILDVQVSYREAA